MLITNATIITFDENQPLITDGAIAIIGNRIQEIGASVELSQCYLQEESLDAHHQLVLPGMILPHYHIYSALARGIPLQEEPPQNFLQILQRLWWRLDKQLSPVEIRASAQVALLDCIRSGITTVFDHHASPNAINGSLEILAEVFAELSLRGCLCYEVSDRDGECLAHAGIEENIRFAEYCRKNSSDSLAALFGLHASFTVSDRTLAACSEAARNQELGFHFHLAEGSTDRTETRRRYGHPSPVKRLANFGLLNDHTIAAHAVDVTSDELQILRDSGVMVVHNPQSNMNNGVGFADVEQILAAGIPVGLGTDGMTTNLLREIQAAYLLPKHEKRQPSAGGMALQTIIEQHHPRMAGQIFNRPIGKIQSGNLADLILIRYQPPTPITVDNYWQHLLFGFGNNPVQTMIVGGRVLMKDQEILICDAEKILAEARNCAAKFWQRF